MEREEILRRLEEVNARIAEIKAKIASRKAGESDTDDDAEYRTARHDYIVNGDRSGLDAYWRGKEAEKQRRAQEEANRIAKEANDRAAKDELDKANQAALQEAKDALEIKAGELKKAAASYRNSKDSVSKADYDIAQTAYNQALRNVRRLDPDFVPPSAVEPEEPSGDDNGPSGKPALDMSGLRSIESSIAEFERQPKGSVTKAQVDAVVASLKPFDENDNFHADAQKMLDRLDAIYTKEKKLANKNAAEIKAKTDFDKKIEQFNGMTDSYRDNEKHREELDKLAQKYGYKFNDVSLKYEKEKK